MKYAWPYTPGAGAMPSYLAGRDEMLDNAEKALRGLAKGYPQKSVVYYGLRGVGKTVLLNAIEEHAEKINVLYKHIEIAERRSFLVQIANASKSIIHQMSVVETAKDIGKKALGVLQAFQLTYSPEDQTFYPIFKHLRSISKRKKRLCGTLDKLKKYIKKKKAPLWHTR